MTNEEEGRKPETDETDTQSIRAGEDNSERLDPETREAAAQAGGYNLGTRPAPPEPEVNPTQPDIAAVDDGDVDDGRIETQAGREAAGPFTGTGNQDALRTAGRTGASDAHHADQRTSGDESAAKGAEDTESKTDESAEGQAADADDGRAGENRRFGSVESGTGEGPEAA